MYWCKFDVVSEEHFTYIFRGIELDVAGEHVWRKKQFLWYCRIGGKGVELFIPHYIEAIERRFMDDDDDDDYLTLFTPCL